MAHGGWLERVQMDRLQHAIIGHTAPNPEHVDYLIAKAAEYNIGWVYAQHVAGSTYNPLSIHLQLLAERASASFLAWDAWLFPSVAYSST